LQEAGDVTPTQATFCVQEDRLQFSKANDETAWVQVYERAEP
jgi:hypothetical protein